MITSEAKEFLGKIKDIWPTTVNSDSAAEIWAAALFDVPFEVAVHAFALYVRGIDHDHDWPPKPADILRAITQKVLALPSEDDAWRIVSAEIARVGTPHRMFHAGAFYEVGPVFACVEIALAVESVGYRTLVTEEGTYAQKAFKDAYKRYAEQTRQKAISTPGFDVSDYRIDRARTLRTVKIGSTPDDYAPETIIGTLGIQKDGRRSFVALTNRSDA